MKIRTGLSHIKHTECRVVGNRRNALLAPIRPPPPPHSPLVIIYNLGNDRSEHMPVPMTVVCWKHVIPGRFDPLFPGAAQRMDVIRGGSSVQFEFVNGQ